MSGRFSGSAVVDRPIDEVFAYLADGDERPGVQSAGARDRKTTDGPPGVGTVYVSTVKDAGMKTEREFELTAFEAPTKIRWAERSKNMVTVPEGGYDLEAAATRRPR